MKLQIELPKKWLTERDLDDLGWMIKTVKPWFRSAIEDRVIDKLLEDVEIPKVEITPEEIKDRMIQILAERALEK